MTTSIKKYSSISLYLFAVLLLFSACNKDFGTGELINYDNTVKSKVDSLPQFSFFRELYRFADSLTLSTKGESVPVGTTYPSVAGALGSNSITAFIPTNEAFTSNGINSILVDGKLNPALLKFLTRDSAQTNLQSAGTIRNFITYNLNNRTLDPSVFTDNFAVRGLTAATVDTVFIRKTGGDYYINGFSKIDLSSGIPVKNGYLYAINSLVTPVYNGQFIQLIKLDTSLTLFNLALTRANDASVTSTANTTSIYNTVFAPTNQAFIEAGLTSTVINATTPAALATIIKNHIVRQRLFTNDIVDGPLTTLNGTAVTVTKGSIVTLKSPNTATAAKILGNNINYSRGLLYKIDKVLRP